MFAASKIRSRVIASIIRLFFAEQRYKKIAMRMNDFYLSRDTAPNEDLNIDFEPKRLDIEPKRSDVEPFSDEMAAK